MTSLAQQKLYFRSCRSQHSPGYVWPPVSLKCCSTLLCSYRATMSRAGSPVSFRCSGLLSWLDIKVFSVAERWNCSFSLDRKVSPLARASSCSGSDQGKRTMCTYKNVKKKKKVLHLRVSNTDFKVGIPQPRLPERQTEPEGLRLLIACGGQQLQFRNVSQDKSSCFLGGGHLTWWQLLCDFVCRGSGPLRALDAVNVLHHSLGDFERLFVVAVTLSLLPLLQE